MREAKDERLEGGEREQHPACDPDAGAVESYHFTNALYGKTFCRPCLVLVPLLCNVWPACYFQVFWYFYVLLWR